MLLQPTLINQLPDILTETGDGGIVGQLRLELNLVAVNKALSDRERRFAWYLLQTLRVYENTRNKIGESPC